MVQYESNNTDLLDKWQSAVRASKIQNKYKKKTKQNNYKNNNYKKKNTSPLQNNII